MEFKTDHAVCTCGHAAEAHGAVLGDDGETVENLAECHVAPVGHCAGYTEAVDGRTDQHTGAAATGVAASPETVVEAPTAEGAGGGA